MGLFREHADVSVRPAIAQDEAAITRVQLRAWRASHTDVLGAETLKNLDVTAVRDQWAAAISAPPPLLTACSSAVTDRGWSASRRRREPLDRPDLTQETSDGVRRSRAAVRSAVRARRRSWAAS